MDDEEYEELTEICAQFTQQGKKRGGGGEDEEEKDIMKLLIGETDKDDNDEENNVGNDEGSMFVFFRKVFDKLPDR